MNSLSFFNLFANATISFWTGVIVVFFFVWLFRIKTGPWKLAIFLLPFLKVLFDFIAGVPANSILAHGVNPYLIPEGTRLFSLGIGLSSYFGPTLNLRFWVKDPATGSSLPASVGDFLYFWIKHYNTSLPLIILSVALIISAGLIVRRLFKAVQFEKIRRHDLRQATMLSSLKVDRRHVDIYISPTFTGTPFTGGVVHPYICIPETTYKSLTESEISAVIAHEIGHIKYLDLVFTIFVQFLGDLFWFIPGYNLFAGKIDRMREVVADQFAVNSGASAEYLASALLKLKESSAPSTFTLYSAFTRERSLLKLRVLNLLGENQERPQRLGWNRLWVRVLMTALIAGSVSRSTIGGNHSDILHQRPMDKYLEKEIFEPLNKFFDKWFH
ncbi:MAG: M56 family metallopeptidase [Bdellovibrio sp.]|nr:M56 family metallopeptidase [Bdellovibrio sp.]